MNLAQNDSGGRRTVPVGEEVVVALAENPTTGYRWEADFDASVLQELADGYAGPTQRRGAPGTRRLAFKTLRAGVVRLQLELRRPWEPVPVESFVIDLDVAGN